jgi:phosphatidylglycerol:prolipoprotein diacylglycerol transferase
MTPPGIQIWLIKIPYYGMILMFGAVMAAWLASRLAKRDGEDPEIVWDVLFWVLIGGIIGARLWHVAFPAQGNLVLDPETGKLVNPYFVGGTIRILDILTTWNGGLGIPGAILGGTVALFLYCRRKKISFLKWADYAAPALALGQAIGRWGNYVNAELCGYPTNLPWGITRCVGTGYPEGTKFHPIFLYESLWSLFTLGILLLLGKKLKSILFPGDLFLIYLIMYPLGRFLLEFLRMDIAAVAGVNANQTIMAIVAISSAILLLIRHLSPRFRKTKVVEEI